ncbi:MAG: hypothetical protein AAF492_25935, partial [Verrucomicrobiota bacterium]
NPPTAEVSPGSGGSYGGAGGTGGSGTTNPTYGDTFEPTDLGTGGRGLFDDFSLGGGRVRIRADRLTLDGAFLAQGADGTISHIGGGSGGSIWVDVGSLCGSGHMGVDGGSRGGLGSHDGGGGRIAVYYDDSCTFDLVTNLTVTGFNAGTVYLGDKQAPVVVVASTPAAGGLVPSIDNLTVRFSIPIESLSFTLGDVLLAGPGGPIGITGIQQIGPITYDIGLAAFLSDGLHDLSVGPDVFSPAGQPMNEDGDGTPGEPVEDAYRIAFTVDATPPAPPAVTNYVMAPSINSVTTDVVTLEGTRESDTAVWVDGVEAVPLGSGPWSHTVTNLAEGNNIIELFSRDEVANRSVSVSVQFFVDTEPPAINDLEAINDTDLVIRFVEETSGLNLTGSTVLLTFGAVPVPGTLSATSNEITFSASSPLAEGSYDL